MEDIEDEDEEVAEKSGPSSSPAASAASAATAAGAASDPVAIMQMLFSVCSCSFLSSLTILLNFAVRMLVEGLKYKKYEEVGIKLITRNTLD